jgi:hypothetical protein
MVNAMIPVVVPVKPELMIIQGWFGAAVHEQLVPVTVRVVCPVPPVPGKTNETGSNEYVHGCGGGGGGAGVPA